MTDRNKSNCIVGITPQKSIQVSLYRNVAEQTFRNEVWGTFSIPVVQNHFLTSFLQFRGHLSYKKNGHIPKPMTICLSLVNNVDVAFMEDPFIKDPLCHQLLIFLVRISAVYNQSHWIYSPTDPQKSPCLCVTSDLMSAFLILYLYLSSCSVLDSFP